MTFAPIAVAPEVVQQAPPRLRRRWLVALAATGVVLTAPSTQGRAHGTLPLPSPFASLAPDILRAAAATTAVVVGDVTEPADDVTGSPAADVIGLQVADAVPMSPVWLEPVTHGPAGGTADPAAALPVGAPVAADAGPPARAEVVPMAADRDVPNGTAAELDEQLGALPDGPVELARAGPVRVVTEGSAVELVGYHEANDGAALVLDPVDELPPVAEPSDDDPVVLLPSRGRAGAPTSAIDIATTPDEPVVAPISGEVVQVAPFALYGTTADLLIVIRADDDPEVTARVMHVDDPLVADGDRVEAGVTPIAGHARQLSFDSQIDRFTTAHRGAPAPHVHVELHRG